VINKKVRVREVSLPPEREKVRDKLSVVGPWGREKVEF
jgi:hypothetical protein